jgi:sensor histidine kinase YesM
MPQIEWRNTLRGDRNYMGMIWLLIYLLIAGKEGKLQIKLENSIGEAVLKKNPELKTVKKDKDSHGFGMHSIRDIIKKYDGSYYFREEGENFCQEIKLLYPKGKQGN